MIFWVGTLKIKHIKVCCYAFRRLEMSFFLKYKLEWNFVFSNFHNSFVNLKQINMRTINSSTYVVFSAMAKSSFALARVVSNQHEMCHKKTLICNLVWNWLIIQCMAVYLWLILIYVNILCIQCELITTTPVQDVTFIYVSNQCGAQS